MTTQASLLPALLTDVTDFLEESLLQQNALQTKLAEAQAQLNAQEKVYLEKVAAAHAEGAAHAFPEAELNQALSKMAALHIITPDEQTKLASQLKRQPAELLGFMTKLAEALVSNAREGSGVEKEASEADDDPDGWKDLRAGRLVKVRKY